jgi:hypothetical protein
MIYFNRWKKDKDNNTSKIDDKKVLEFVAIRRKDSNDWVLPGVNIKI